MNILIRELKKSEVKDVALVYSMVIHASYISYGEIAEGLAKSPTIFSPDAVKNFEKYITRGIGLKSRITYVALVNEIVVGFICVRIQKAKAGHFECWIDDIGVDKKFRRLGIAKRLLTESYAFGKRNKTKFFLLESGVRNTDVHRLFEKEGFKSLNTIFIK